MLPLAFFMLTAFFLLYGDIKLRLRGVKTFGEVIEVKPNSEDVQLIYKYEVAGAIYFDSVITKHIYDKGDSILVIYDPDNPVLHSWRYK